MATKQTVRASTDATTAKDAAPAGTTEGFTPPLWLAIVLVVTGAAGLLAAFTLTVERIHLLEFPDEALGCDINPFVTCSGVMTTPQARIFGFPNPIIGLMTFPAVIIMGVLSIARVRMPRWVWTVFTIGVVLGLVLALWLWQQSVFVLGVICPWCFVVYMTMSAMMPNLTVWGLGSGAIPAPAGVRSFLARWGEWSWVLSLALAVTIVLVIVIAIPSIPRYLLSGY